MKKTILLLSFIGLGFGIYAQIPNGYYDSALGLNSNELQEALHLIIKDHNASTYSDLWDHFQQTDKKTNGKVWDIYSDVPGGTPPYQFTFITDQCGNYSQEGDCYNREHSFPSSWFGGNVYPMYSDLNHIYPTDGWVNNKRSNYPYGEVGSASWTSMNGSKLGNSNVAGYSGVVFEPIDTYKGDLARMHFYMATRYLGEDGNWPGSESVNGSQMKDWTLTMLYEWHQNDPVSQKEISRNNAIYQIQNNRNPFIDHPEFVDLIWFYTTIDNEKQHLTPEFAIFPNPADDFINVKANGFVTDLIYNITITDQTGRLIIQENANGETIKTLDVSGLPQGFYLLNISEINNQSVRSYKLVK
ncbi:MAG: endonuclease [Bacteroidales bacterium]|nr:endonuclease [Bacteroidales bacterium]